MNSDGLKKIYLIKSAGYEFTEVDIADNTLLLGESGVGKTTLMRAVLFFYTMDYSDSVLNLTSETKKSFNDWYFKEPNSHIVYEYTKGENRYLFVVSKSSKLHYTFIDITQKDLGVREIFIEQKKPIEFEMLHEKIQKESLLSYTTTIKDRYIQLFHKRDEYGKKIKTDAPTEFYLFEDIKSRKEFARTLSNIFASSSIRSTNIKKTIVSLIENPNAKIALLDIRTNLNKYALEKKEIERFEKKIPIIQDLAQEYATYQQNKREFKEFANRVVFMHKDSLSSIAALQMELEQLNETKQLQEQKYLVHKEILQEERTQKKTEYALKEKQLDDLESKQRYFQAQNISFLLQEYKKEKQYKEELQTVVQRYELLTSDVAEVESRYKALLFALEKNFQNAQVMLQQELSDAKLKENEHINTLIEQKEQRILQATATLLTQQQELVEKEKVFAKEFATLSQQLGEMKYFAFKKEQITQYEQSIKSYDKKLLELKSSLLDNESEIKEVEQKIEQIKSKLSTTLSILDEEYTTQKDILFSQREKIEKKLDFDAQNLYGYLMRNEVQNAQKIATYLKDEILFSSKEFHVKRVEEGDAIFGLALEFEEEFHGEYAQEELLHELKTIKSQLKELHKQTQKMKHKEEDLASREMKEKQRQRTLLYKRQEELQATQKLYIEQIEKTELQLAEVKKEALQLKEQELQKLHTSLASLESQREKLAEHLTFVAKKIDETKLTINHSITKQINDAKAKIKEYDEEYKQRDKLLQEEYNKAVKNYNEEKLEALKAAGVDQEVLASLQEQKSALEERLKSIELHRKVVYSYLESEQELEKIELYKEQLQELQNQQLHLEKQLEFLQKEHHELQKELQKKIQTLHEQLQNLQRFVKKYKQRIENSKMQTTINKLLVFDFTMDVSSVDDDIIEQLLALYEAIKANEAEIKSLVLRALKDLKFDNIFQITIPKDFIEDIEYTKTAKELVEYIQKEKLTPLKDALSEQFKGEIRKITKELDIYEDALLDIYAQIKSLANSMRKAVASFNVIDSIEIRAEETNNNLLHSLRELVAYYEKHSESFLNGLFDTTQQESKRLQKELENRVMDLVDLLNTSRESLELEDGFVLEFKIVEKGNNLKWRQNIDDIGSNGTSTLVKSVINISMLQMVSKNIVKESEILTHCVLDEIGTISTDYFRELKEFVNRSGFVFLNGMPIEDDMLISMYPTIYIGQNHNNYSKMILASKMEL